MGIVSSSHHLPKYKEENSHKVLNFLLGASLYPILLNVQMAAQECLKAIGVNEISPERLYDMMRFQIETFTGGFDGTVPDSHPLQLPILVSQSVGTAIVFQDFVQTYLLEKKIPLLLRKVSPDLEKFTQNTRGKITRILLTSLLFSVSRYYIKYPTYDNRLALKVNDFICGLFCSSLKEFTGSSMPSVALNIIRDYLTVIY